MEVLLQSSVTTTFDIYRLASAFPSWNITSSLPEQTIVAQVIDSTPPRLWKRGRIYSECATSWGRVTDEQRPHTILRGSINRCIVI
jgi:hypothetical protein